MIEIHYDYTDGTEVSYIEGVMLHDNFNTHCLNFFSNDYCVTDVVVLKKSGEYISLKEIFLNDGRYTYKEIRPEHNVMKLLVADHFVWQNPKEVFK